MVEAHAGKTLVIELWDPGDAQGKHSVEIRDPSGGSPACTWEAEERDGGGTASGTEASCVIDTSKSGGGGGGRFNNWLVTIRVALPADTPVPPTAGGRSTTTIRARRRTPPPGLHTSKETRFAWWSSRRLEKKARWSKD